jgi:molecular chaperone IbpA
VALAGFTPDEVALTIEHSVLTLEGRKSEKEEKTFLHRGISARNSERQSTLADHVKTLPCPCCGASAASNGRRHS